MPKYPSNFALLAFEHTHGHTHHGERGTREHDVIVLSRILGPNFYLSLLITLVLNVRRLNYTDNVGINTGHFNFTQIQLLREQCCPSLNLIQTSSPALPIHSRDE